MKLKTIARRDQLELQRFISLCEIPPRKHLDLFATASCKAQLNFQIGSLPYRDPFNDYPVNAHSLGTVLENFSP